MKRGLERRRVVVALARRETRGWDFLQKSVNLLIRGVGGPVED